MELLKMYFKKRGLDAKCTSEDDAIKEMKEFMPHFVIVDVMQIEAAKKFKQDQELSRIPIVLMTGKEYISKDYSKIADEVIHKPFVIKEIDKIVTKYLDKAI